MTAPANPFLTAPAPVPTPEPAPAPVVTPAPIASPAQDPAYQAFLAQQAAAQQAAAVAAQAAAQPVAPAPAMDPAYVAYLAQQQAAQAAAAAPVAPVAPVAPQPQAAAPLTPAFVAPAEQDPFADPAPQRPKGPRLQEMAERLLLIVPKLVETVRQRDDETGEYKDVRRMTADVVVLDGGPMPFGGDPQGRPPRAHDKVAEIPYRAVAMYVSAVGLVSQCETALDKRKRGETAGTMVIGRLGYGESRDPKRKPPWLLAKATDPDKAIARAYLATVNPFD